MLVNLGNDGWSTGSWPVGSGSRDNNWGRTIGPDWSGSVSWGRGIDGLSRVLDISNVTSVGISSGGNSLEATIGKSNVVRSLERNSGSKVQSILSRRIHCILKLKALI